MSRKKWEEAVTYEEVSTPDIGERKALTMFNGGNGDLYVAIHDVGKGFAGKAIRIERSGGASTRNPRLVQALTIAYDAIAKNEEQYEIKSKALSSNSDLSIEELLELYNDIKNIANSHVEEEKLKREFIKNFKNDYKIVEK